MICTFSHLEYNQMRGMNFLVRALIAEIVFAQY